jgi:hypothetical protein
MKKSKFIKLVLVTSVLATANNAQAQNKEWGDEKENQKNSRLHVRTDTTRNEYTNHHGGYFHFYPWGYFLMGSYHRSGYGSSGLNPRTNGEFSKVSRGGFGRSAYRVGS